MKTQLANLRFEKQSIVELNKKQLMQINGGTTGAVCDAAMEAIKASSQGCAEAAADALVDAIQNFTNAE